MHEPAARSEAARLTPLAAAASPVDSTAWPPRRYAWYVVAVLLASSIVSFLDRQIIALVVQNIKASLKLTDLQIGLLQGPPFGIFYAVMALPIAFLADRYSRRNLVIGGLAFWSLATAACGLAGGFVQLFTARACVAVGEATLNPCAYSIISDCFARQRRAFALSIYTTGTLVGVGLAMVIGGAVLALGEHLRGVSYPWIGQLQPWQFAFVAVGLPGFFLSLLLLTVREPTRRGRIAAKKEAVSKVGGLTFGDFIKAHGKAFFPLFLSFALLALVTYANFAWVPTYFIRMFGWGASKAGYIFGAVVTISGAGGTLAGGWLSDVLDRRGHKDAPYRAVFLSTLPVVPLSICAFTLAPNAAWAMSIYAVLQFFTAFPSGLAAAAMMALAPNEMRAKTTAVYYLCVNLIGVTLGATSVGFLTTQVFHSDQRLGLSLAIVTAIAAPLALLLIGGGMKHYRRSISDIERQITD